MNDDTIRKRLRVYVPIARETYLYEKIGDRLKDYYSQCYHNPGSGMKSERACAKKQVDSDTVQNYNSVRKRGGTR